MGEGEISYDALLDLYKKMKQEGASRKDFLHEVAKIPGIYVPSLYEVSYKEDGTIAGFEPVYEDCLLYTSHLRSLLQRAGI